MGASSHTGKGRGVFDHMGQVEVNALDRRVLRDDHAEHGSRSTADVDQRVEALEAPVRLEDLLHGDGGVVSHPPVEDLVESGVSSMVLERGHPVGLVERNSTI